MKKIVVLFLVPIIALSIIGTYAYWSKTISSSGTVTTAEMDKIITDLSCRDNGNDPGYTVDVATCTPDIENGEHAGSITIDNAYPGYRTKIDFTEKNVGTIPVRIRNVILGLYKEGQLIAQTTCNNSNCKIVTPEVEISFKDNIGVLLEPQGEFEETADVHILEGAIIDSDYVFKIEENIVQFNVP